jgi:hypothetical protein
LGAPLLLWELAWFSTGEARGKRQPPRFAESLKGPDKHFFIKAVRLKTRIASRNSRD